ncbi:pali-domain-containing protein [Choiromyces venosus 120613-1]|uniref:Pali-domain-containing protein n=1 Tax=Choiromyces venosus 120613-1 TaxID=1336337 RepID=A0A3N4K7S5_9PEZI|nr:pali-domain-containing protein [Choiromyces venosus 120613-1]
MRLRPATPLCILLFAAFALLLLSVLSTPVITSIHLASYNDTTFGVFGFCDAKSCSSVRIGYNMGSLSPANADFSLPSIARNSLSNLLIVHPIAALFTLILLVLAVISHLPSPAHSPGYLLALLILSLPTFLLSLLAFLVDILIFLPHVQWGGWVVLGATILIAMAGIVMCGMRRTVVSKKARRKRIEDNAAMNGQEFYASQTLARERTAAASTTAQPDKIPEYATFEVNKTTPGEPEGERIPLNPRSRTVSPPIPGTSSDGSFTRSNTLTREPSDRSVGYGLAPRGAGPLSRPMPTGQVRNQYSNGTLQTGTSGSSGPYGVPPPQRGGYDRGYGGDVYGERGSPLGGFRGPTPPGMYPPAGGLAPPPRRGSSPGQFGPRPPPGNAYGGGGPGYGMGPPPNNGMMSPPPQGGMRGGQAPYGGMGGPPPGTMMMGGRGGPMPPPGPQQYDYPEGEIIDERREFEKTLPMAGAVGGTRGEERGGGPSGPNGSVELDTEEHPPPPHAGRLSVVNENGRSTPRDE